MLNGLFDFLEKLNFPGAGLFQYITFRAALALILSLIISMLFGGRIIRSLKRLQIGESIRDLGLDGQLQKSGTPTMGGLIIILAIVIPCLLIARLSNVYIIIMLFATIWLAAIGFADDYIKVFRRDKAGLHGKFKIFGQIALGVIVALTMIWHQDVLVELPSDEAQRLGLDIIQNGDVSDGASNSIEKVYVQTTLTNVPFFKDNNFDYKYILELFVDNADQFVWIVFIPLIIFIITAVSNAANLTDGLDGLASGLSAIIAVVLGVFAYVSGNTIMADYLNVFYIPYSEELVIYVACLLGGCVGFLWYNSYPAQVFMGDTGSLTLGGVIAVLAILLRKEFLIPLLCGVFLVETLSVILQVSYFKYTKRKTGVGERIFLMSPIHHHYQKKGLHETKIVTRMWIIGILLAVITIVTLKIR